MIHSVEVFTITLTMLTMYISGLQWHHDASFVSLFTPGEILNDVISSPKFYWPPFDHGVRWTILLLSLSHVLVNGFGAEFFLSSSNLFNVSILSMFMFTLMIDDVMKIGTREMTFLHVIFKKVCAVVLQFSLVRLNSFISRQRTFFFTKHIYISAPTNGKN